jgi:ribokinase
MAKTLIVLGSLNTDIVATGLKRFPKPGEHVYGKELVIGPGGKSRNIADMAAHLMEPGAVAMLGRTTQDKYGFWQMPIDALHRAGVNTDYVVIDTTSDKLPGIALIPVDEKGNNQIIVLPGISDDFSPEDVDAAGVLFEEVAKNNGYLALTLECPLPTAHHAIQKAKSRGLKIVFDPGGIESDTKLDQLLDGIYLIKPNEHEAKILTGVEVTDFDSAKQAAQELHKQGIENVFITHGINGAYLFSGNLQKHIPIPDIEAGDEKDETGCGDQTMAALCAFLQDGKPLEEAAELAVLAGTLQFYRQGIQPVVKQELETI